MKQASSKQTSYQFSLVSIKWRLERRQCLKSETIRRSNLRTGISESVKWSIDLQMEVQVEWLGSCKMSLLLLFCLLLFSHSQIAAARVQGPGFLYTRTRGRCTPQFWSGRREKWPRMVPETSAVWKVFGSRTYERYSWDLTLVEAAARNDEENAFGRLVKEATAALLNSYTREGYPYRPWQVKTLLIQALVSEAAASSQAKRFSSANLACD